MPDIRHVRIMTVWSMVGADWFQLEWQGWGEFNIATQELIASSLQQQCVGEEMDQEESTDMMRGIVPGRQS